MKAIITVGISGSGKSTWAEQQANAFEINRDKLRWQITGKHGWSGENAYKFSSKVETEVTRVAEEHLHTVAKYGEDVIISDTNLNPKFRQKLIETCKGLGYEVEIKEFPISFQEALKRDKERGIFSVGEEVLKKQWEQWIKYNEKKGGTW
jgi:predicted kinase